MKKEDRVETLSYLITQQIMEAFVQEEGDAIIDIKKENGSDVAKAIVIAAAMVHKKLFEPDFDSLLDYSYMVNKLMVQHLIKNGTIDGTPCNMNDNENTSMMNDEEICKQLSKLHGKVVAEDGYDEEGIPFFVVRGVAGANVHTAGEYTLWGIEFDEPLSNGAYGDLFGALLAYSLQGGEAYTVTGTFGAYFESFSSEDDRAVAMERMNQVLEQIL